MSPSGMEGEPFRLTMTNYRVLNVLILVSLWSFLLGVVFTVALRYSSAQKALRVVISKNGSEPVQNSSFVDDKVPVENSKKLMRMNILRNDKMSKTLVQSSKKPEKTEILRNNSLTKTPPLSSTKLERIDILRNNSLTKTPAQSSKKFERVEILRNDSMTKTAASKQTSKPSRPRQQRRRFMSRRKRKRLVHSSARSRHRNSDREDNTESVEQEERAKPELRDTEMKPRPPKCLIVGFSKCGTEALKGFLSLHPDIVAPLREVDFFTNYYDEGLEWYRRQMPPSMASQITIEKTPEYILTRKVLNRIRDYDSNMRLIVMIRDPIVRLQSLYLHDLIHKSKWYPPSTTFKRWCGGGGRTAHVASVVDYVSHIQDAFDIFSKRQVLVQSEEELERSPIKVLRTIESFLGLPRAFSKDNFFYSGEKGFYCFNMSISTFSKASKTVVMDKHTGCFTDSKGRHHQKIAPGLYNELVEFAKPYNKRLFQLLGRRYSWENFS